MSEKFAREMIKNLEARMLHYINKDNTIYTCLKEQRDCIKNTMVQLGHPMD